MRRRCRTDRIDALAEGGPWASGPPRVRWAGSGPAGRGGIRADGTGPGRRLPDHFDSARSRTFLHMQSTNTTRLTTNAARQGPMMASFVPEVRM